MSFIQERERRSNAGSRMRALLDQEVDIEELFEYDENDEEDEEFSAKENEMEEDKVDSDFDLDSSEGEQEHIEEGKELDKQLEKQEKRARKNAFIPPPAASQSAKKPTERKKRQKVDVTDIQQDDERTTRHSYRKNTMLNRILVEDQIREQNKRKALQTKRDRPVVNKLTQEELLAEAAVTEEKNKDSLLEWQQKEAERKENAKKKDKQGITGSFVRYHSFLDKCVQEKKPTVQKDNVLTPDQENSDTGVGNTINQDAADVEKRLEDDDLMGRNLITFVEAGTTPNRDSNMDIESADKDLDLVDLIDQLAVWREKDPKPNKPILCPITGSIAKYRIPQSGVPYADIEAYKKIKTCEMHQQNWSSLNGLYLGNLPSADGVPNEWY